MSPRRKHITLDKPNKLVIFHCQNKAEMRLVLDRYIAGCREEAKVAWEKSEAEEIRDTFQADRGLT